MNENPRSDRWTRHARVGLAVLAALLTFGTSTLRAEDWPGWRGPRGDGLSTETGLPVEWGPEKNVVWKTKLEGRGHSSPIVVGNAIFLLGAIESEQRRVVYRIDFGTGRVVWERTVLVTPLESIHRLNSYASSTPASDGKRVFVTFLDRDQMYVAAYDFDGNRLWETRPGPFSSKHGFCTCPVLFEDKLIVNGDHDGDAYIALLRQDDGSIVWKTPRENRTRSYSTPILARIDGRDQFMLNGSFCTAGYDVRTGERLWICDGPSEQMVATLVRANGLIFSLGGYPERHLLAIKEGGEGDITKSHIVWRTHVGIPYVPSPLLYGDLLHVVSDEGIYTCFDPATGYVHVRQRASKHISASLVGGDGRVYLTDDAGTTVVLANRPDYQVLATNRLGEEVYASPALSQGSLLLRATDHLYRIANSSQAAAP